MACHAIGSGLCAIHFMRLRPVDFCLVLLLITVKSHACLIAAIPLPEFRPRQSRPCKERVF